MPLIEKEYISTGKISYVFMNFPLAMHKFAFKASEAGLCAGDQSKFWEMHDKLFENQRALEEQDLIKYAEAMGLDMTKFKSCLDTGKYSELIKDAIAEGGKAGISGTPTFLLGFAETGGKVKAVKKIVGAQPYPSFKVVIDAMLSSEK